MKKMNMNNINTDFMNMNLPSGTGSRSVKKTKNIKNIEIICNTQIVQPKRQAEAVSFSGTSSTVTPPDDLINCKLITKHFVTNKNAQTVRTPQKLQISPEIITAPFDAKSISSPRVIKKRRQYVRRQEIPKSKIIKSDLIKMPTIIQNLVANNTLSIYSVAKKIPIKSQNKLLLVKKSIPSASDAGNNNAIQFGIPLIDINKTNLFQQSVAIGNSNNSLNLLNINSDERKIELFGIPLSFIN